MVIKQLTLLNLNIYVVPLDKQYSNSLKIHAASNNRINRAKHHKKKKHGNEIKLLGLLQKLRCQGKVHPINGSWPL